MGKKVDLNQVVVPSNFVYVDPNRSDTYVEDGSSIRPYKTFQNAISNPGGFTSFFLNPGTYTGSDVDLPSGDVIVRGVSRDSVIIRFSINAVAGTESVVCSGFTIGPITPPAITTLAENLVYLDLELASECRVDDIYFYFSTLKTDSDYSVFNSVFIHNNDSGTGRDVPCLSSTSGIGFVSLCDFSKVEETSPDGLCPAIQQYGGVLHLLESVVSTVSTNFAFMAPSEAITQSIIRNCTFNNTHSTTKQAIHLRFSGATVTSPNIIENCLLSGSIDVDTAVTKVSNLVTSASVLGDGLFYEGSDSITDESGVSAGSVSTGLSTLSSTITNLRFENLANTPALDGHTNKILMILDAGATESLVVSPYKLPAGEGNDGDVLTYEAISTSAIWSAPTGGGASTLVALTDTPVAIGSAGTYLKSLGGGSPPTAWSEIVIGDIKDFPDDFGSSGKFLKTDAPTSSASWQTINVGDLGDFPTIDGASNNKVLTSDGNNAVWTTKSPVITLGGDLSGSATLTNLGNATLTASVDDDSHNHVIGNIDNFPGDFGTDNYILTSTGSTAAWEQKSPTVTLSGFVSGAGTMTNLGNVTINTSGSLAVGDLPVVDDFISGLIEAPEDKTYLIVPFSGHDADYSYLDAKTDTGTCSIAVVVDSVTLGTYSITSTLSNNQINHLSSAVSKGHKVELVVTSLSAATEISFSLRYDRTFTT
jgi:hypothetical protein